MKLPIARSNSTPLAFTVLALVFGFAIIHLAPPLWGVDEVTHFARIYQISHGALRSERLSGGGYGGMLPDPIIRLNQQVAADLADDATPAPTLAHRNDVDNRATYGHLVNKPIKGPLFAWDFTGAAAYSLVAYPGSVAATVFANWMKYDLGTTIMLARAATLLVYVIIVAAALWLVRRQAIRWLLFVIALLPMSLFQAATMSPDALLIALTLLMIALVTRLRLKPLLPPSRRRMVLLTALAASAVLIPLIKPTYAPLSLIIVAVPPAIWSTRLRASLYYLVTFGVLLVSVLAWGLLTSDVVAAVGRVYAGSQHINAADQVKFILLHPIRFLTATFDTLRDRDDVWVTGIFGRLGWNFVLIPTSAIVALTLALGTAVTQQPDLTTDTPRRQRWFAWACIVIGIVTLIGVVVSLYAGFNTVGSGIVDGVQGRYFIPALAVLLYGVHLVCPLRLKPSGSVVARLIPVLSAFSLIVALITYRQAL